MVRVDEGITAEGRQGQIRRASSEEIHFQRQLHIPRRIQSRKYTIGQQRR